MTWTKRVIAVGLLTMPILFFWTVEQSIASGPYPMTCELFGVLTNGFVRFDGCRTYHTSMYLLMAVNIVAALYLLSYCRRD
jgi:hypothetical protein